MTVKSVAQEAHEIAGRPKHILGSSIGAALAVSTASGVGTYQINRKLSHIQGDVTPPLSATTGTTPSLDTGKVVQVAKNRRKRKGGKYAN